MPGLCHQLLKLHLELLVQSLAAPLQWHISRVTALQAVKPHWVKNAGSGLLTDWRSLRGLRAVALENASLRKLTERPGRLARHCLLALQQQQQIVIGACCSFHAWHAAAVPRLTQACCKVQKPQIDLHMAAHNMSLAHSYPVRDQLAV